MHMPQIQQHYGWQNTKYSNITADKIQNTVTLRLKKILQHYDWQNTKYSDTIADKIQNTVTLLLTKYKIQ